MTDKPLYCSFCGKNQDEVAKLIAGPSVFICDECTDLCAAIVHEERQDSTERLLAMEDISPSKLPEYVTRLKMAIQEEQRERASILRELRDIEFEVEAQIAALLEIAFPERSGLSDLDGNPMHWSSTCAYTALGGRIEQGQRLDSYEDLKGDVE